MRDERDTLRRKTSQRVWLVGGALSLAVLSATTLLTRDSGESPAVVWPRASQERHSGTSVRGKVERPSGRRAVTFPAPARARDALQARSIRGRVVDATSGSAIQSFRLVWARADEAVRLFDACDDQRLGRLRYDPAGRFEVELASAGTYSVLVDSTECGYPAVVVEGIELSQDLELVLALERGTHLYGTVLAADDTPVPHRAVELCGPLDARAPEPETRVNRASGNGEYLFAGLEPGVYRFGLRGEPDEEAQTIEITAGDACSLDLRLQSAAILRVRVETSDGLPLDSATLVLARKGGEFHTARAETSGCVRVAGLTPDRYALGVMHPGYRTVHRELSILDPGPTDLRIVMEPER